MYLSNVCITWQADYEGYIPNGVLKKQWFTKHCTSVPSLLVLFYDLEWNDPQWGERQLELASRVQVIRWAINLVTMVTYWYIQDSSWWSSNNDISGIDTGWTRFTILLLWQQVLLITTGVSQSLNDKVMGLCEACQLPQNCLFLLPYSDRIMVYILKYVVVIMTT